MISQRYSPGNNGVFGFFARGSALLLLIPSAAYDIRSNGVDKRGVAGRFVTSYPAILQ